MKKYCNVEVVVKVYYFFDDRDTKALRFMIFYDKQSNFERIQGEDTDSKSIWTNGCIEGTLYPDNKGMEENNLLEK